jgi:FkbM family methyltransferase
MSILKRIKKELIKSFFPGLRRSYSQSGEDIIISDLFHRLKIDKPSYLDIGANEPIALSNTYRLYTRGCTGVCIEPNPILFQKFRQTRKRDICINAGISFDDQTEADYYLFEEKAHGFNTFSKQDAEFWEKTGNKDVGKFRIEKTIHLPLLDINKVIASSFKECPNFISLDVEGLDLHILQRLNFSLYSPQVFCIETLEYKDDNLEGKNEAIISFMKEKGYFIYADTYINTIFCLKSAYRALA